MVDKLLLNNQLLANKSKVQKAKNVVINKLVQKIRKLKSLAEKKPEDTKIKGKVLKNIEILSCVKKLRSMEILRKALINNKNPLAIITNGTALPEEIAEAILFTSKQIIEIVRLIADVLSLNEETNPGWKDKILELSKNKQKQLRTEQKKEIRQQRKERHQLSLKRSEWLEENLPENLLKNDKSVDSKESEIVPNETEVPKEPAKKLKEKPKKDVIEKPLKKHSEQPLKKHKKEKPDIEQELEVVKSVDPFFITQNGDNYLSTVVVDRVQPEAPNDGLVRKERRAYQNEGNRRQPNRKNNFKNNKSFGTSKMHTLETNNKWKNKNVPQNQVATLKKTIETEEELHPSWACKQKERGIKEFSGKKIVFGENEQGNLVEKVVSKSNAKAENMHPSWEPKQKQKGIKVFSGNKIKFEDGESNNKSSSKRTDSKPVTEEKLHPSWEAKQKLKPVISEFKGKKIKFDD